jgi:hypothetical protein
MAIENPKRFEIVLPAAQKQGLAALAADMGMNSAAVAKLSIARMLASHDLVLTGDVAGDPLANFLRELEQDQRASDPAWIKMTAVLARALSDLDIEADTNPSATALADCLRIVAGARGSIENRIKVHEPAGQHPWHRGDPARAALPETKSEERNLENGEHIRRL